MSTNSTSRGLPRPCAKLVQEADFKEYLCCPRASCPAPTSRWRARKPSVDEWRLTHEQLCATLADCGDDLAGAASRILATRGDAGKRSGASRHRESKLAELVVPDVPTPFRAPD
jgi:hypothetical protein